MERKQDRPCPSCGEPEQVSNAGPTCSLPDSTAYGDEESGSLREGPRPPPIVELSAQTGSANANSVLDLRPSKNLKTGPHLALVDFGDHVAAEAAVTLKL
jgi:hypothetical protein